MESQLKHPQHNMINDGDHQDEQHGEKKSVLEKVKAKARKIKETIKKHGHLHDEQQDQQRGYDPEFDEDEDESDELEEAPEVHGAPIYESQEAMVGVEGNQGLHHLQPIMERTDEPAVGKDHTRLTVPTSHGHVEGGETGESNIITPNEKEAPIGPRNTLLSSGEDRHLGSEATELKLPVMSLEEDLNAPRHTLSGGPHRPGNYQAKVTDPTGAGAEETPGIAPLLRSLDKMTMSDKSKGSHDQESERPSKYRDLPDDSPLITGEAVEQDIRPPGVYAENAAYATAALADKAMTAKDTAAAKLGYGDDNKGVTDAQSDQTSYTYTEKASQAGSFLANKAVGAKDVVASKLGYGGTGEQKTPQEPLDYEVAQSDQTSYTEKASQAASLLANKAVGAKDVVASKLGYGGTAEHKTPREPVDHEALMQQSRGGYVEKISGVSSALADKAVGANNVVASKLGYDQEGADAAKNDAIPSNLGYEGTQEHQVPREPVDHEALMQQQRQGGYVEKILGVTSGVTSALADKAVGAKNVVASKLGYDQEGVSAAKKDEVASNLVYGGTEEHGTPREPVEHEALTQQRQEGYGDKISGASCVVADKAVEAKNVVASKLGAAKPTGTTTWAEKLKPGDEDKALSQLIASNVYKKESREQEGAKDEGTISDSLHKQEADDSIGKVTVTEEVVPIEEKKGEVTNLPGSETSPRQAVVDKIKVAVSSWWSPGDQTPHQSDSSKSGNHPSWFSSFHPNTSKLTA
ncbi:hypothetical protein QQ045_023822 [Rhodiola kirilowii]